MRSRVDCGLSLVMLSFSPMRRLSSVDLPAFGLPTTVTIPARDMAYNLAPRGPMFCRDPLWMRSGYKQGHCRFRRSVFEEKEKTPERRFVSRGSLGCRRRPTLPRSLDRSTIGAAGLNDRVRDGNGCGPCAPAASDS